jgi:hypothetical protein
MSFIKHKFPDLVIWKPWNNQWYTDLYGALKVCGIVAAIKGGKSIGEKPGEINQELLINVAEALLKKNTRESIKGYAVLVMLYHAVSSVGEVSNSNCYGSNAGAAASIWIGGREREPSTHFSTSFQMLLDFKFA